VGRLDDVLFGDEEIEALFGEAAEIRAMLQVEAALARAEGRLGIIPAEAAARIDAALATLVVDPRPMRQGTARAGVPIIALLDQLRPQLGDDGEYLHWGATSQDILDTALVLRLRTALQILEARLASVIAALARAAEAHRYDLMLARTRWQQALPTTFGLRVANWLMPLIRHRERLSELRPRLLLVQFGGAAGTLAALGDRGLEVMQALAEELDLAVPPSPWHVQRDGIVEAGQWLALVAGSLGKLGQDVALLAQTEIGEVSEAAGGGRGGSSTMPQKVNPILPDVLTSIARHSAALAGSLHGAALAEHERGASAWQLEWLALPQLFTLAGAALRHAEFLALNMQADTGRMTANLQAPNGLFLAEAAAFALARHMPMAEAKSHVAAAIGRARAEGRHLVDCLAEASAAAVDWQALRDPRNHLGSADAIIDRVLAAARRDR
jgi:3-carboxy-cis,cis-muconate cycloisomerase